MKTYAGIGNKKTPENIINIIKIVAILLSHDKYVCATGACTGADQAFAEGTIMANGFVHLHVPWESYEIGWRSKLKGHIRTFVLKDDDVEAYNTVAIFHPAYHKLSPSVKALHARSYNIVKNASFMVCWTEDGQVTGGTGQAIKIATYFHLPIYNLGNEKTFNDMLTAIKRRKHELAIYDLPYSGIFQ